MGVKSAKKRLIYSLFISIISFAVIAGCAHVSHAAADTWNYKQLRKINKTKKEFCFVVFGDTRDSKGVFDELIERINQEDALFAIDNGDFVSEGKREEYESFLRQIRKINKPLLAVIGNHDIEKEVGKANYKDFFGDFQYSFFIGDSYFIVLDVTSDSIEDPQLYWLEGELLKSQKYKYRFVFMHVPLYDPRLGEYRIGHSLGDANISETLNEIFDKNNVTMLFTGHIHGYFRGTWGKTPYIITGGGGAPLTGSDGEHFFHHYIKVKVSDSGVQYDIVKFR